MAELVVAHLDLYAEEEVLGVSTRLVREAGVSFGRATVASVADTELPPSYLRRQDIEDIAFRHLIFPFSLDDLPAGHRYTEVTVEITFDDPRAVAVQLGGDPLSPAELLTWGEGQQRLRWRLSVPDVRLAIQLGDHQVRAVAEFPAKTVLLSGAVDATAQVTREVLDKTRHKQAGPREPLRFTVNVEEGRFEFGQ